MHVHTYTHTTHTGLNMECSKWRDNKNGKGKDLVCEREGARREGGREGERILCERAADGERRGGKEGEEARGKGRGRKRRVSSSFCGLGFSL